MGIGRSVAPRRFVMGWPRRDRATLFASRGPAPRRAKGASSRAAPAAPTGAIGCGAPRSDARIRRRGRGVPPHPTSAVVVARQPVRLHLLVQVALGDAGGARHLADLALVLAQQPRQVLALE